MTYENRPSVQAGELPMESAGCCGVFAGVLGFAVLLVAAGVLTLLLIVGNPDRWQGVGEATVHPLAAVTDPRATRTIYLGTEQGSVLRSRDGGQTWATGGGVLTGRPISTLALAPDGTALYAGTSAGVYRSTDAGGAWQLSGPGLPPERIVDALGMFPDGTLLAGTVGAGVYRLRAAATLWEAASDGLPLRSDVYTLLVVPERGMVYAGLISGGIYASADGGTTWQRRSEGLPEAGRVNVFALLAVQRGQGAGRLLAGTARGVYASADGGTTWVPSTVGIATTRALTLAHDPQAPGEIYAGTDTGVFVSRDGGTTWQLLGYGLPAGQHVGLVFVGRAASGDRLVLASVDRLYRYPGAWLLSGQPLRGIGVALLVLLVVGVFALLLWRVLMLDARQPAR